MIDLKGLNPPQREAVLHGDGPRSCWRARAAAKPACSRTALPG